MVISVDKSQSLLVSSSKMAKLPGLTDIFGVNDVLSVRSKSWFSAERIFPEGDVTHAAGWGMKDSSQALRDWAEQNETPFCFVEDGFLSYETHPSLGASPLSLSLDRSAMHYNCFKESDLERLIATHDQWFDEVRDNVGSYMRAFVLSGLSKYNHGNIRISDKLFSELGTGHGNVMVMDQVVGDYSVMYSGGSEQRFDDMLHAALEENPDATVFVKVHPDTLNGKKKSYLLSKVKKINRVKVINEDVLPASLFPFIDKVYTVSSLTGFEALLHDVEVVCFASPFYAGWGLTDDRATEVVRRTSVTGVTLEVLFAAAYIKYPIYIDPFTGGVTTFERTLARMSVHARKPVLVADTIYVQKFSPWKRRTIKHYLAILCPDAEVVFSDFKIDVTRLKPLEVLLVWGSRERDLSEELAPGAEIWCVEDGFLRSVGLGSDLYLPSSLSFDDFGMHFDVYGQSRLEKLCIEERFEPFELNYAKSLIEQIKTHHISKYNVGNDSRVMLPKEAHGKRVILVAGQVEGDRSIELSGSKVKTNIDLLKMVQIDNPDAYVIYKPHPDVVSGNRPPEENFELLPNYYDLKLTDVSMSVAIELAHEVHVISSQSGFEALLYGKEVHCYGMPFYAGWGLTIDHAQPIEWRRGSGHVSVESLFLCSFVIYPTYFDWHLHRVGCCEQLLHAWRDVPQPSVLSTGGWWRKFKNAVC